MGYGLLGGIVDISFTCLTASYFDLVVVARGQEQAGWACHPRIEGMRSAERTGLSLRRIQAALQGSLTGEACKVGDGVAAVRWGGTAAFDSSFNLCQKLHLPPKISCSSHSLRISFCPFEWILKDTILYTLTTPFLQFGLAGAES